MKQLACNNMGYDCPFVAIAETKEKAKEEMMKHHAEVHGEDISRKSELEKMDMRAKMETAIEETEEVS